MSMRQNRKILVRDCDVLQTLVASDAVPWVILASFLGKFRKDVQS